MQGEPMFNVKTHKQAYLFDPWSHLGPKRRTALNTSWAGLFQKHILPSLPVDALRSHYHEYNGRPSKELYSMMGLMILQQMFDLTDDGAVEQFCFNIQWHYALNIASFDDQHAYVSAKTLWSMRDTLSTESLYHEIFTAALKTLEKLFQADLGKQRMDSVHIRSNMRHLGRIGLFVRTIKKFLLNLKRHHRLVFDRLDQELVTRYMSTTSESLFAMVKPSESKHTLDQLARDVYTLTQHGGAVSAVRDMASFKLLLRLFTEQCVVDQETGGEPRAVARPNKEVPSDSLQNPSDPDAGYSGHKGQGYQIQVVESHTTNPAHQNTGKGTDEDEHEDDGKRLSLITHVAVESADKHDSAALIPALDDLQHNDALPEELLADSLYGSDDNCETAHQDYEVRVIAPVMTSSSDKLSLADCSLDEQGRVLACPEGRAPKTCKKTRRGFSAAFSHDCLQCEVYDRCPVSRGKKACYFRYTTKDIRLARRRQGESTAGFTEKYRYRAGVEATMSEFDRRTGVKHLRVRGMKAVGFAAVMKAVGVNIFRAARQWKRRCTPISPQCGTMPACFAWWSRFTHQYAPFMTTLNVRLAALLPTPTNRLGFRF
jgi:hypothetical protein